MHYRDWNQRQCAICWIIGIVGAIAAIVVVALLVHRKLRQYVDYSFTDSEDYWLDEGESYGVTQEGSADADGVPYTAERDFDK